MALKFETMSIDELEAFRDGTQAEIEALRADFKAAGLVLDKKRAVEGLNADDVQAQIVKLQSQLAVIKGG